METAGNTFGVEGVFVPMSDYKTQLWDEIARNDPPTAQFLKSMQIFNYKLHSFRWKKKPRVVICKYERHVR